MIRKIGVFIWNTVLVSNKVILYFLMSALILTIVGLVVVRYIPGAKIYGITELVTLASAHLYFAAGAYVVYKDELITVNVLSENFEQHKTFLKYVGLFKYILSVIVCSVYGYWALQYFVASAGQYSTDLHYPRLLILASLVLGFALFLTFTIYHLRRQIRLLRKDAIEALP